MTAELGREGNITITAETVAEAFALQYLIPIGDDSVCRECGRTKMPPIIINCSILNGS